MRHSHYTITPTLVCRCSQNLLQQTLPWKTYGRTVSVPNLLRVLLLLAALRSSLSAVVRRFRFGFSHETARQAVQANLPAVPDLTTALVATLHRLARHLRRRCWVVAMDLHYEPFYGDRNTPGIIGGQKKQGTNYFYGYATAELVHRRHRYTVGLIALHGPSKPHEVVAALLRQIDQHGLKLRGVVLDSGFDSGETLLLLQKRGLAYTVPLRRKGRGNNRRNSCFAQPVGTVTTTEWVTEDKRLRVKTQVVVVQRPGEKVGVYAFAGWTSTRAVTVARTAVAARQARMWYRRRFGIESSYRQLHECQGRTTKKDVGYRLLLVGLSLLLRQVWVWLTWQLAQSGKRRASEWLEELPLQRLLNWLSWVLQRRYPEEKSIKLRQPLIPIEGLKL